MSDKARNRIITLLWSGTIVLFIAIASAASNL